MKRYGIINNKDKREIVLLRGSGCTYKGCLFCDYHNDSSSNEIDNFYINKEALDQVNGTYSKLEVVNSGSFCDLDKKSIAYIINIALNNNINTLIFECNYQDRIYIKAFREKMIKHNIKTIFKIGIETFDYNFRENILNKGINTRDYQEIAALYNQCCLLFGLYGQSLDSMLYDINMGLKYFDRICINLMVENSTIIKPDQEIITLFNIYIYNLICDNDRIDILLENTNFEIGG